ncbi:MAG: heme-copper oxidase subunit III [Chloroflexi bacterium]|nr:heme-copper oxidase subunit III [Chloroflexota bacterium]
MTTAQAIQKMERPSASTPYFGMLLFLVSESFLFGALFWAYYYLKVKSPVWPPEGVHLETALVSANTAILLISAASMQAAILAIRKGHRKRLMLALAITILLGSAFLAIKGWEWVHSDFRPWDHAYGSIYFTITGFHGIHVLGGILLLGALLVRAGRGLFDARRHLAIEVAGLYWHYVDLVWIAVFATIFIIR